jgi:C1A family cysteine protease
MSKGKYAKGWVPDRPDWHDHLYSAPLVGMTVLPPSIDLRPYCPPVVDQGQLGSCTANAIAGAIEFDQMKQKITAFAPSRLFIYYNERAEEGTVSSDSGAAIRDGIRSVNSQGACSETDWPYDISQFTVKPPEQAYTDALLTKAVQYQRINNLSLIQMLGCLASESPFVFGVTVYESFESQQVEQTGIVPMPQWGEQVLGGHCMTVVGYNTSNQWFIVRNSWGTSFGDKGYLYIPFQMLVNPYLSSDFWTIKLVS